MNLIDLLDIRDQQKDTKRPEKVIKVIKAKSKARATIVSHIFYFLAFLGSLGPNRLENGWTLNSETRKATWRPIDSRIWNLLLGKWIFQNLVFLHSLGPNKVPQVQNWAAIQETAKKGQKRPLGGVKIQRYQKTVKVDDKGDKMYWKYHCLLLNIIVARVETYETAE